MRGSAIPMVLVLLLMSACDCQRQIFYIRPSNSSHCPQEVNASQCYDLTTLVSEGNSPMASNTSLLFLPGEHFLEHGLDIMNIEEFQMSPYYNGEHITRSGMRITCTGDNIYGGHSVRVQNVSVVKIDSISFQSCGVDVDSSGVLQLRSVDHSEITNCKWHESRSSAIFIEDSNSVISDCLLVNGSCSSCSGGAVRAINCSNITFTGSNVIRDNIVLMGNGGGLSLASSNLYVEGNLTVDGNSARNSGGMEITHFSNCTFNENVDFSDNSAAKTRSGGGMGVGTNSHCTFNRNVEFTHNSARFGGGIEIMINSSCTFNGNVMFSGNIADYGGGMDVYSNSRCTFNEMVAFFGNSAANDGGGMEVGTDSHCTFNRNVEFTHNSARFGGGMITDGDSFSTFNGNVIFSGNSASTGGGMRINSRSHCTFKSNVEFSGNSATDFGGGVHIEINSSCAFNGNVVFSGNIAYFGGGMDVYSNSYCTFNGSVAFLGNYAIFGGGMEIAVNSQCIFRGDISFSDNYVENNGGGMLITGGSFCYFNGNLSFSGNSARSGGGLLINTNSNCSVNGNITFSGNSAANFGGGMRVLGNSQCIFRGNILFSGNTATGNGGGVRVDTNSNCAFIGNVSFSSNRATEGGGGMITLERSYCTFDGSVEFSGNRFGGGMLVFSYSMCTFSGSVNFFGNSAAIGGGMNIDTNSISIFSASVEFSGNSATANGGGMLVTTNSNCIFNGNVLFSGNSAPTGVGGGVYITANSSCSFKGNVEFTDNDATFGGGMEIDVKSNSIFSEHVVFSGNNATISGGGISVDGAQCTFSRGVEISGNSAVRGGGMTVFRNSQCTFDASVEFSGNIAIHTGGGMRVSDNSNCTFNGQIGFSGNNATNGGGMEINGDSRCTFNRLAEFLGNCAGRYGISIDDNIQKEVRDGSHCDFFNDATFGIGGGIFVHGGSLLEMNGETIMRDNLVSCYGGAISLGYSEMRMRGYNQMTSNSAKYGGAIYAKSSKVSIISGNVYFENNGAKFGGGLALATASILNFPVNFNGSSNFSGPSIEFISNRAQQYGGAIWVESTPYNTCTKDEELVSQCFVEFEHSNHSSSHSNSPIITAVNNTALAGSNIYAGNMDSCLQGTDADRSIPFLNELSSDLYQVCLDFCSQSEPDCSTSDQHIEVFSGEQLELTLVPVGQKFGTLPIVLYQTGSSSNSSVIQTAKGSCRVLTITSDNSSVNVILYPERLCPGVSLHILTVRVGVKPCPPGFVLHRESKSCTCDDKLKKLDSSIVCDINSQSFSHRHGVWMGYVQPSNTVIYHSHCPFDYCTQELSTFNLNNTDKQCRYNRSGLICGACKEGYSLTLGGSKCNECSHVYLVLFIPLALAGVVLVLFLLTFKITVSMGTINGLIFFANIIGTNSSTFLPPETTVVLKVFIAWLNLDLGIDTCLFDGLDEYIKVWLQFVFPFYVFILIAIIIFLSQRSTLVTKCFGSDPVAVLATLILLAYTKLVSAVLTVMSFTYIRSFDGSSIAVWLYDGNVKYMSGKHIPLFMFALLIMLLLIIPYTVILLFAPYLQRISKNRVLYWINDHRLQAFLHSYYAPLKDKYRSWIGVLLVLRLCLLIVFVSNSLGDPSINLFAITAAVILLLCCRVLSGIFYSNWFHDALELFFIMKLGLFSVATLYILHTGGNQRALTDTLVGAAFIVFVAIIVYHGWRQLTDSRWWRLTLKPKWQKYFHAKNEESPKAQEDDEKYNEPQTPQVVTTTFIELREPVLDFC